MVAMVFSAPTIATLELAGRTAPWPEIDIVPVPSDDIVAPPKLIVCPERYKSLHLNSVVPRSNVLLDVGTIFVLTAVRSTAPPEDVEIIYALELDVTVTLLPATTILLLATCKYWSKFGRSVRSLYDEAPPPATVAPTNLPDVASYLRYLPSKF
jgi:xanthosine utilization system XapX-like protein